MVQDGHIMQSTTDTEVILHLVARSRRNRFIDRFIEALRQIEGAYALVAMTIKNSSVRVTRKVFARSCWVS